MTVQFHEELLPYLVPIESIAQHPRNVNSGDVEAIAESIMANGFFNPCIVQRSTGFIIAGNHRYAALVMLGETQVPVVSVEVDDNRALRMMLADNRTAELARRDERGLAEILAELSEDDEGLTGTAYDDEDLSELLRKNRASDHIPIGGYGDDDGGGRVDMTRRVTVYGYLEDNGTVRPFDDGDAEETVVRLRELGYNARGGFD